MFVLLFLVDLSRACRSMAQVAGIMHVIGTAFQGALWTDQYLYEHARVHHHSNGHQHPEVICTEYRVRRSDTGDDLIKVI